ncbi:MAG: glycosyltransferase family 4 protein [Patescibacteria group bacterium]
MKINVMYETRNQPWGGGNQFLKALKEEFIKKGIYEESPQIADVILFNSHHNLEEVFKIKKNFSEKIFIHRIDGPVYLIRGRNKNLDRIIYRFNNLIADGTIFQSKWCLKENMNFFQIPTKYQTSIYNAPNKDIFNKKNKRAFGQGKTRLIATSWSSNMRKGFDIYKYLDENLNFSKYEMTFVGNSPVYFKNIKHIKPVSSIELANILKEHDIYITASQNDPCSNSLIEALSCGLPAVVLNSGGHLELVGKGGEFFFAERDIIEKIDKVAKNYNYYIKRIKEFSIDTVAKNYYEFAQKIYKDAKQKKYVVKKLDFYKKIEFYKIKMVFLRMSIKNKIFS